MFLNRARKYFAAARKCVNLELVLESRRIRY